jgi:hypothetical protein
LSGRRNRGDAGSLPGLLRLAAITAADWAAFQKMTALAAEPRQLFSVIGGEQGTSLLMSTDVAIGPG